MPSSYMRFAIDFNGDGKRDLWDAEDAIGRSPTTSQKMAWRAKSQREQ